SLSWNSLKDRFTSVSVERASVEDGLCSFLGIGNSGESTSFHPLFYQASIDTTTGWATLVSRHNFTANLTTSSTRSRKYDSTSACTRTRYARAKSLAS